MVTPDEVVLMHKLAELVPGGMNRRVLVCESGREALARAIELARNETDRTNVTYLSACSEDKPAIGRDVAAVVAHPLDGRIKLARQACDAAGALLIDDEAGIGPGNRSNARYRAVRGTAGPVCLGAWLGCRFSFRRMRYPEFQSALEVRDRGEPDWLRAGT